MYRVVKCQKDQTYITWKTPIIQDYLLFLNQSQDFQHHPPCQDHTHKGHPCTQNCSQHHPQCQDNIHQCHRHIERRKLMEAVIFVNDDIPKSQNILSVKLGKAVAGITNLSDTS